MEKLRSFLILIGKKLIKKVPRDDVKIVQFDLNKKFVNTWDSIYEAGISLNIDSVSISKCCRGKIKTYGGYIWRYIQ